MVGGGIAVAGLVLALWKIRCRRTAALFDRALSSPLVVDFKYPSRTGLDKVLKNKGYALRWADEEDLRSLLSDGWRLVTEKGEDGFPHAIQVDKPLYHQILVYRKFR